VGVAQHEAGLIWQLLQQQRGQGTIRLVGGGEPSGQRYPHAGHGGGQVQLPPVNPPVPTALGPMRLRIYGGVGNDSGLAVFLVPHPATRPKHRGVQSYGPPARGPRSYERDQVPAQAPYLGGQGVGQRLEAPLERSARRGLTILLEQEAKRSHLGGRLGQHALSNSVTVCRWRTIMMTKALRKSRSVYTRGRPGRRFSGAWGVGRRSTSSTRVTSKPCWPIIAATSTCVVLVW
jgi:hypothetical protein